MNFKTKMKREKKLLDKYHVDLSLLPLPLADQVQGDFFTITKSLLTFEGIKRRFTACLLMTSIFTLGRNSAAHINLFMCFEYQKLNRTQIIKSLTRLIQAQKIKNENYIQNRGLVFGNLWREIAIYAAPVDAINWVSEFKIVDDKKVTRLI